MRKFLGLVLTGMLLFCTIFSIVGCREEKDLIEGSFYSLEEAYENGWLTEENLEDIAGYHNNGIQYPERLNEEILVRIKTDWAKKLREDKTNPISNVTADEINVYKYYGTYGDCVVIMLDYSLAEYPAEYIPSTIEIGGITFNFSHPRYISQLVIWKS
ncbi:MAG: hypothetical protein E7380_02830 [Clostridiales bacterium]|nr:hypothetical protein [Clostridiales bacterium]